MPLPCTARLCLSRTVPCSAVPLLGVAALRCALALGCHSQPLPCWRYHAMPLPRPAALGNTSAGPCRALLSRYCASLYFAAAPGRSVTPRHRKTLRGIAVPRLCSAHPALPYHCTAAPFEALPSQNLTLHCCTLAELGPALLCPTIALPGKTLPPRHGAGSCLAILRHCGSGPGLAIALPHWALPSHVKAPQFIDSPPLGVAALYGALALLCRAGPSSTVL